jgi:hypothetical protein
MEFRAFGYPRRKTGRPIKGGPNTPAGCEPADCESADVCDPFLGLCLGGGSRLYWKLEHRCFLPFKHVRSSFGPTLAEKPYHSPAQTYLTICTHSDAREYVRPAVWRLLFARRSRRRSSALPSLSQLHIDRAPCEYAAEFVTNWQRGAAGQGCCCCRMEGRPLIF